MSPLGTISSRGGIRASLRDAKEKRGRVYTKGEKEKRGRVYTKDKENSPANFAEEKSGLARIGWRTLKCLGHLRVLYRRDPFPNLGAETSPRHNALRTAASSILFR
jgi:hypothetical protein